MGLVGPGRKLAPGVPPRTIRVEKVKKPAAAPSVGSSVSLQGPGPARTARQTSLMHVTSARASTLLNPPSTKKSLPLPSRHSPSTHSRKPTTTAAPAAAVTRCLKRKKSAGRSSASASVNGGSSSISTNSYNQANRSSPMPAVRFDSSSDSEDDAWHILTGNGRHKRQKEVDLQLCTQDVDRVVFDAPRFARIRRALTAATHASAGDTCADECEFDTPSFIHAADLAIAACPPRHAPALVKHGDVARKQTDARTEKLADKQGGAEERRLVDDFKDKQPDESAHMEKDEARQTQTSIARSQPDVTPVTTNGNKHSDNNVVAANGHQHSANDSNPNICLLQYPASLVQERYLLQVARDQIDSYNDIITAVRLISEHYLVEGSDVAAAFSNPENGHVRQLEKARNLGSATAFKAAAEAANEALRAAVVHGLVGPASWTLTTPAGDQLPSSSVVSGKGTGIPAALSHFVLTQVYDRTAAPAIERVARYKPGTDYVYGELRAPFISDLLRRRLGLTSASTFVDLGSGVGNVVLQAALEIGCDAWGCEFQPGCHDLALLQAAEFSVRCAAWGLLPGSVHLLHGDFTDCEALQPVLRRADALLVNNQAFTSGLNDKLVAMFLDLKKGCKIVSLKSFVHESAADGADGGYNSNDVAASILDVEHFTYPPDWVSWTASGGRYVVSTRK